MKHPLPDAALDGRICIVGISGSGKSTTAKGGVERLLDHGRRVCVVDLLDGWWGLRVKRDGHTPAFPVAIFGGGHGDLPLTEHAGALIGQAVAQSQGSTIVSLSELDGDAARRRFALAFFNALHNANRAPLHLVIDEADFYAPQQPVKDGPGPLLLNRVKEIAARGRMRGFRCWPITQRPAKLHKDVLSQADTLIAMQLTSSQDRDAIEGWIGDQGDKAIGKAILASLPSLKLGQGVLWSPRIGVLEAVNFPLPNTYDSSRTPEYGEKATSVELKPIDLGALREKMGKVEAEAKANDPAALRREIARLKAEIVSKAPAAPPVTVNAKAEQLEAAYQRGVTAAERARHKQARPLRALLDKSPDKIKAAIAQLDGVMADLTVIATELAKVPEPETPPAPAPAPSTGLVHRREPYTAAPRPQREPSGAPAEGLTGPMQRILDALAWWLTVGVGQPSRVQVAAAARYNPNGGSFNNPLGALRSAGLVDYPGQGLVAMTEAGVAKSRGPSARPTTAELHERVFGILNGPQRRILEPLLSAYPDAMPRTDLAAAANYDPGGGSFNNPLGSLRTLGLVDYPQSGQVVALPILFVE